LTSEEVKNSGERRMKGHPGFTVLVERRIFQLQRRVKLDTQRSEGEDDKSYTA
jgi:hypothetical protein